jgi:Beta protein
LIEIPPIPWDFAAEKPAKSSRDHVSGVAETLSTSWASRIFLDACLLADEDLIDDRHPLALILEGAAEQGLNVVPVTGLTRGEKYTEAVNEALDRDKRGACLRLEGEDLEEPEQLPTILTEALNVLSLSAGDVDLVVDLGAITAEQQWAGATVRLLLAALPQVSEWRTLTLIASSFPLDLSGVDAESVVPHPRAEWTTWRALYDRSHRIERVPTFGDYAISHPSPREVDPRIIQRSAAIRYTVDDEFVLAKGRSIRQYGADQHYDLAAQLVARPDFHGDGFSWGDSYIAARARREPGPGNGMTWRKAGTSQHLAFVTSRLASLRDA